MYTYTHKHIAPPSFIKNVEEQTPLINVIKLFVFCKRMERLTITEYLQHKLR